MKNEIEIIADLQNNLGELNSEIVSMIVVLEERESSIVSSNNLDSSYSLMGLYNTLSNYFTGEEQIQIGTANKTREDIIWLNQELDHVVELMNTMLTVGKFFSSPEKFKSVNPSIFQLSCIDDNRKNEHSDDAAVMAILHKCDALDNRARMLMQDCQDSYHREADNKKLKTYDAVKGFADILRLLVFEHSDRYNIEQNANVSSKVILGLIQYNEHDGLSEIDQNKKDFLTTYHFSSDYQRSEHPLDHLLTLYMGEWIHYIETSYGSLVAINDLPTSVLSDVFKSQVGRDSNSSESGGGLSNQNPQNDALNTQAKLSELVKYANATNRLHVRFKDKFFWGKQHVGRAKALSSFLEQPGINSLHKLVMLEYQLSLYYESLDNKVIKNLLGVKDGSSTKIDDTVSCYKESFGFDLLGDLKSKDKNGSFIKILESLRDEYRIQVKNEVLLGLTEINNDSNSGFHI
jgi:hypothetical protein